MKRLLRSLLTRLGYTLPVLWLVVSVVFLLIHIVPGDPIEQMLGEGARPADIVALRHAYGLDLPLERNTRTTGAAFCTAIWDDRSGSTIR